MASAPEFTKVDISIEPHEIDRDTHAQAPLSPLDERVVQSDHTALRRKVRAHTVPWLFAIVLLIAMFSRTFGYAALTMVPSLGLSSAEYGLGSSIFYAGFMTTQLPAIWLTRKLGAPRALAGMLLLWGITASLFATLRAFTTQIAAFRGFCCLRLFLGAAEGGLLPCMFVYLSVWYGQLPDRLSGVHGQVTLAAQIASVVGGLVALPVLKLDGFCGMEGWQWLFVLEAVPVACAAAATPRMLARDPEHAPWLNAKEVQMLRAQRLRTGANGVRQVKVKVSQPKSSKAKASSAKEQSKAQSKGYGGVHRGAEKQEEMRRQQAWEFDQSSALRLMGAVLRDMRVIYLAALTFFLQLTLWSLIYWQPLLIQEGSERAVSDSSVIVLAGISYACGVVGTYALGWHASSSIGCCEHGRRSQHADQALERRWHSAIAMAVGGVALCASVLIQSIGEAAFAPSYLLLCVANAGLWSVGGLLATWPSEWLTAELAAVALAVTSTASAIGGLVGPALVGLLARELDGHAGDGGEGRDGSGRWKSDQLAAGLLALSALVAAAMAAAFTPVQHNARESLSLNECTHGFNPAVVLANGTTDADLKMEPKIEVVEDRA